MTSKIDRPNSGGLALLKKSGKKHFKKMANKRWENFRKEKKLWEQNHKNSKA